jgi:hypothetical protein
MYLFGNGALPDAVNSQAEEVTQEVVPARNATEDVISLRRERRRILILNCCGTVQSAA